MKILWQLFISFFKIGAFTFGGGLAMLPVIRKEVLDIREWIAEEELVDCFAIAQSLPGVLALNVAIYVGNKTKGIVGAVVSAIAIALPAFLSIIIILLFLTRIEENVYVLGAFEGVKAASVGLILVTVYHMAKKMLIGVTEILIAIASFLLIVVLDINAIWAVVMGGLAGYFLYIIRRTGGES